MQKRMVRNFNLHAMPCKRKFGLIKLTEVFEPERRHLGWHVLITSLIFKNTMLAFKFAAARVRRHFRDAAQRDARAHRHI